MAQPSLPTETHHQSPRHPLNRHAHTLDILHTLPALKTRKLTHRAQDQGPADAAFYTPSDTHTDPKEAGGTGSVAEAHLVGRVMEVYPPEERGWMLGHKTVSVYIHTISSNFFPFFFHSDQLLLSSLCLKLQECIFNVTICSPKKQNHLHK